jgi:hypothetical protein
VDREQAVLNINSAERLVRPSQHQALIRAVLVASDADELWVEWKSDLDLTSKHGQYTVARAILGFANRMPEDAQRFAQGRAYVLVGVEPGQLSGVTEVDSATLYPGIEQYCGALADGPNYHLTYVPFDAGHGTQQVLVVEVEPPTWGDSIHALHKDYDNTLAGTIFIRRPGRTERANHRELQLLVDRARRQAVRAELTVTAGLPIRPVQAAPQDFQRIIGRAALTVNKAGPATPPPTANAPVGLAGLQDAMRGFESLATQFGDRRTREEYQAESKDYLTALEAALPQAVLDGAAAHLAPLQIRLTNQVAQNLAELELVLDLPTHVTAVLPRPRPDGRYLDMPARPAPYGAKSRYDLDIALPDIHPLRPPGVTRPPRPRISAAAHGTRVVFPSAGLRPLRSLDADAIILVVHAPTDPVVRAEWSATATNIDAVLQGVIDLPVGGEPLSLDELLAPPPNWAR